MSQRTSRQEKRAKVRKQRKAERMKKAEQKRKKSTVFHTRPAGEHIEELPSGGVIRTPLFSIVKFEHPTPRNPSGETPLGGRMDHNATARRCHELNKEAS